MDDRPSDVYKYETFGTQSLVNLKSQQLYFGSPKNFNDPYDCATPSPIDEPTSHELLQLARWYRSKHGRNPDGSFDERYIPDTSFKEDMMNGAKGALQDARSQILDQRGVTCFSECNDNLLMWAHYSGKYQGFCLAFDTSYEPFNKLRQVKYVDRYPGISISKVLIDKDVEDVLNSLLNTKSAHWAYEREWRIVHNKAGTLVTYEPNALKAVYFGPEATFTSIEIICLVLQGQNRDVEFYQARRSESEYRVEFKRFDYTSHLNAKQLGLI